MPSPRSAVVRRPCHSDDRARVRSARDCPEHRSAPGFWWSCRPWNDLWPGSGSPFCALSMALHFDDGGVDHRVFHVGLVRAGIEEPLENIGFGPIAVALEDGIPLAKERRKIAPGAASPDD